VDPSDPITWGKHKGIPIDQVDKGWLAWARDHADLCNPDCASYWPEMRTAIVAVIGEGSVQRPRVIGLEALCARLAGKRITIRALGHELVTSETVTDEDLRDGLRVHKAALLALVAIVEPRQAAGNGSAKFLWAADLRGRIKAWYGALSRQFHPDRGGSQEGQTAVNQCYQSLMTVLQEWEGSKP
jgi:hypothetical protein